MSFGLNTMHFSTNREKKLAKGKVKPQNAELISHPVPQQRAPGVVNYILDLTLQQQTRITSYYMASIHQGMCEH